MHCPIAISLSLKTYGARGKVSKSAGKLEKILLSHSTVCYPGSPVWSLFYFYMRLKCGVTSRSADISTPWAKKGWSSLTQRPCGFLVCLTCRFGVLLQTSQECVLKTFLPFWVCCLQTFQSKALQIFFSSPRQSHSSADALGNIEKCGLLK